MRNTEALQVLKHSIELYGVESSKFQEIFFATKPYILDPRIINEVARRNMGEALTLIDNQLLQKTEFEKYYFLTDLEEFDFEEMDGVTIDEIKEFLHIELLHFCTVEDLSGNVLPYCQHWENERRLCVAVDRGLMNRIGEERSKLLTVSKKVREAKQGYYYRFTIKQYFPPRIPNDEDDYEYSYGAKAYGYDTIDELAFHEGFGGDIDAWKRYNQ